MDPFDAKDLYGDGIYPAALSWRNARLSEVFTLKWTRQARRRDRLTRLIDRDARLRAGVREPIGSPSHDQLPVEVLGPCAEPTYSCCRTGQPAQDGCTRFNGCGCKVMLHPVHPGQRLDAAALLQAQARASHELAAADLR